MKYAQIACLQKKNTNFIRSWPLGPMSPHENEGRVYPRRTRLRIYSFEAPSPGRVRRSQKGDQANQEEVIVPSLGLTHHK
jgi:hypothetical protein